MEEKITRRELFQRAARMLPIIALASVPAIPAIAEQVNDCNGLCKASCYHSCMVTSKGMCDACTSACRIGCQHCCKTCCVAACDGTCSGSATAVTDTIPKTERDSCKHECYKFKNDILNQ